MTLAATTPLNTFTGTGSTNSFPFDFTVFNNTQLLVSVSSPDGSQGFALSLGTDYTVLGLSPAGVPAKVGTVVLVNDGQAWLTGANLTTGWTITVQRYVPLAQLSSIRNQGDFYQEYLENALDYTMMCIQQLGTNGLFLTDIVTDYTYQLVMINGVLNSQRIS